MVKLNSVYLKGKNDGNDYVVGNSACCRSGNATIVCKITIKMAWLIINL